MHKDIEKILYSEKDIENIVNTIAKQIEKDYNDKDFIMVGLLKGSVAFMVDLMRKVNLDFSLYRCFKLRQRYCKLRQS